MQEFSIVQKIAMYAIPGVLAITSHEGSHGYVARALGDRTAEMLGRLTLNPLRHIDLIGTVVVPLATFLLTGFLFGWAKPVPIDVRNLHNPRRDMALVAMAGPMSNIVMALLWALVVKLALFYHSALSGAAVLLIFMGVAGVLINTILCVLNLLPLPPLDGGRVLTSLLPVRWATALARIEPFGLMIILILLLTGVLGQILYPTLDFVALSLNLLIGVSPDFFFSTLGALFGAG